MSSNPFEQKMRERLSGVEIPPRPEVWTQLEDRLRREDRRGGFLWLFFDGALLLLLLSGFLLLPGNGGMDALPGSSEWAEIRSASAMAAHTVAISEEACEETDTTPRYSVAPMIAAREVLPTEKEARQPTTVMPTTRSRHTLASGISVPEEKFSSLTERVTVAAYGQQQAAQVGPVDTFGMASSAQDAPGRTDEVARIQPPVAPALHYVKAIPAPVHLQEKVTADVAMTPLPLSFQRPSRWAWRFSITPEWAFEAGSIGLENNLVASPISADLNALFNTREQSNNVLYGNYSVPNEDIYYRIIYAQHALSANLQAEYFLRPRLSLQGGLTLSVFSQGQYEEGILVLADSMALDPLTGLPSTTTDLSLQASTSADFHTVQIAAPLQLNYYLKRGRSSWILSGGVSLGQQISWGTSRGTGEPDISLNPDPQNPAFEREVSSFYARNYQSHAMFRLLYERQLSTRLAWYMGPSLKYRLNPTSSNALGQSPLRYRAGWEIGIKIGPGR